MGLVKRGKKTGGRKPGTPNKFTGALKDMILEALTLEGGVEYLRKQAIGNPTGFLTLLGKVLPMQVAGPGGDIARPRRVIIELEDGSGS
jgi:hypothetical protein